MRTAVVGGGITGLAAAYGLRRAGHEVVLVEQDNRLGGKILTERTGGFVLEAGPDSFLTTKPQAVALARELGLGEELVGTLPGRTVYVLWRGRLHPLPEGLMLIVPTRLAPFIGTGLFSLREKARLGFDLVLPPRASVADESLGAFVRRRLGGAALDRIAGPLLGGIYAGDADGLSLAATFPQLRQIERTSGSLIRGMLARRDGANVAQPGERLPMFMTLAGGLDVMVDRLAGALAGAEVRTGTAVEGLSRIPSGYALHVAGGGRVEADAVVLATPAYVTADLLGDLAPGAAALLRQIPYASTAAVSLGYRGADLPALDGHGFVVARGEPVRITACTWVSTKWPARSPSGFGLLRAYIGSARDPAATDLSDDEIVDVVRRDLARVMRVAADPALARVARWPRSMPQYTVGHLDRLAEIERDLSQLPGLVLAGAGYRGIGLPDCIGQGLAAAVKLTEEALRGGRD